MTYTPQVGVGRPPTASALPRDKPSFRNVLSPRGLPYLLATVASLLVPGGYLAIDPQIKTRKRTPTSTQNPTRNTSPKTRATTRAAFFAQDVSHGQGFFNHCCRGTLTNNQCRLTYVHPCCFAILCGVHLGRMGLLDAEAFV